MRIDKVHIRSKFKNLEDFEIDIDESAMETVLIGLNATGKSNFMEALVVIFRDLDLERPPQISKIKEPFEYYIKYECRGSDIEIEYSKEKNYSFKVDGIKISKTSFNSNKEQYLPNHVFVYYSGISERLKDLYSDHTKRYYDQIIKAEAKNTRFDKIPRIFLVQNIHSSLALIAFYMFRDQEIETIDFLKDELQIQDFGSALFILKQPEWSKSRKGEDIFWNASGLVRRFLEDLFRFATAPIFHEERVATTYKKSETQSRLYLYIKDRQTFQDLVDTKMYSDKIPLFNALNSIEISDLLYDVKIKVCKKNVDGELAMGELSEGEKQLLTVLGMLKFTKNDESLILLDEPDTHLNPLWKWKYLEYIDNVVKRTSTSQVIICTHDPLVIGNLKRNQVQIFKKDRNTGKTVAYNPFISPREMSVSKILTSELFGVPSVMSKRLEDLLNKKRFLQAKLTKEDLNDEDRSTFERLKAYFDRIGFNDETVDSRYNRFIQLTSEKNEFTNRKYSQEEEADLDRISREVLDEIIREEKKEFRRMKYIDISRLQPAADALNWSEIKANHFLAMASLSVDQRKTYINDHPSWNLLQGAMLNLSNNKCWYSESPIGINDFEVDHFRPKNKAVNHDGTIIKQNGYWWKAYDWDNYRLTGALANKRRRDRLKIMDEVKGKGPYFPLDVVNAGIADDEGGLGVEFPLLLDPANAYDVTLLSFDEKGEPIPSTEDENEIDRVRLSILYYHLDLDQLNTERKIAWDDCALEIKDSKEAIDNSPNLPAKALMMNKCFKKLISLVNENNRPYTSVSKACLQVYSELKGYHWLKNLIRIL